MTERADIPLAVSMGEPAGIGPDLILQLFAGRQALELPQFVVYGQLQFLRARAARLGLDIRLTASDSNGTAEDFEDALSVVNVGDPFPDTPGRISGATAAVVTDAIALAVTDSLAGKCRALVTAPIHKSALYEAGFSFPGHTEYLAHLCAVGGKTPRPVMMLAGGELRVIPVTIHIPLNDVAGQLTTGLVVETARIASTELQRRLGIEMPRLAVTGLNPHAGEDGALGRQEIEIISPAISQLRAEGLDVTGPLPADSVFYLPRWRQFDVVIAMYHDQALIPIKTVAFESAVNVTMGLPIVRTSPDHGTALDIAGTGTASPESLIAALRLADEMSRR
jgi:4-hydroxythreonine-4-phosphate dehydrogenase